MNYKKLKRKLRKINLSRDFKKIKDQYATLYKIRLKEKEDIICIKKAGSLAVDILNQVEDHIRPGITTNEINAIVEDDHGNLWISTNYGISQFNPESQKFKNYSTNDGFQGNQFFMQSLLRTKHGTIYFGGFNGFNFFHPDSLKNNDFIPPVYDVFLPIQ